MDTLTAINNRRSVRKFSGRVPDDRLIEALLKAAVRAPSAGNLQPWHFYVVADEGIKRKLSAAALSQKHVASAPVVFVACADPERSAARYGRRGRELYCIQDTAAAAQNLLLAAVETGLAGCWVGAFDEREVARVLNMSRDRRPLALIPVGYPAKPARAATPRLPLEQVTSRIG
ncbi:MAG: nitroreductase family protein [Thermoleophilia bacterium]|nr:nitroreductase family protein [Thermoleophilia bacterium]